MDYEEFLKENSVSELNDVLSASKLRKIYLEKIEIETCGPRMPGDAKVVRESTNDDCGKLVYGELNLCPSHFTILQDKMKEEGKIIWEW